MLREVVKEYAVELKKLGEKILNLICEGLGLDTGYFSGGLSGDPVLLVNHYPPCPDPSLTLGLAKHRDPSLITILFQEQNGLQVCKDDEWILVEPVPHAFVINVGYVLQVHLFFFFFSETTTGISCCGTIIKIDIIPFVIKQLH